ncbi:hypothetical protein B0T22DRAFT_496217 [Podospora appendiculata]|uniref:Uncharacterized protein n=1 Tax=Podospora appendiculata TaxID=314037 RepID=A0AAE1CGG0_9PEZI|nr:hypothetical protein B0T22DRAFT_496217 [Podospora appendiculata]
MPNLVAVDVSVTDDRISLVFSHRPVADAYAAYLRAEDSRPPHAQPIPGYRRDARHRAGSKEVTLALPNFITWFITCRLPDDEDSVTFTFMDSDEGWANSWANSMVLFEPLVGPVYDENVKQLHVKRLWNKTKLLTKLENLRSAPSLDVNGTYGTALERE